MVRSMVAFVVLAGMGLTTASNEPTKNAPAKIKQYVIEVRVCHGDPLGGKAAGKVEILFQPTVVAFEGETAKSMIGQKVMGIDADSPDFVGLALSVRPIELKDGIAHVEVGCKISEIVAQYEGHVETNVVCARQILEASLGETFRIHLKVQSATDQTWLEARVKEIKEVDQDK